VFHIQCVTVCVTLCLCVGVEFGESTCELYFLLLRTCYTYTVCTKLPMDHFDLITDHCAFVEIQKLTFRISM
jgi:hypothetical protein